MIVSRHAGVQNDVIHVLQGKECMKMIINPKIQNGSSIIGSYLEGKMIVFRHTSFHNDVIPVQQRKECMTMIINPKDTKWQQHNPFIP
jgi:hypothetical protein